VAERRVSRRWHGAAQARRDDCRGAGARKRTVVERMHGVVVDVVVDVVVVAEVAVVVPWKHTLGGGSVAA